MELAVNQEWILQEGGLPYELLDSFDFHYTEYDNAEWMGDVIRGKSNKPVMSGNAATVEYTSHLLARGVKIFTYDGFTDHRTGRFVSPDNRLVTPLKNAFRKMKEQREWVLDLTPVTDTAVLFDHNHIYSFGNSLSGYLELGIPPIICEASRMNHGACQVIFEDDMTSRLEEYKLLFIYDLAYISDANLKTLTEWVKKGNTLLVFGAFAHCDADMNSVKNYATELLGVEKEGEVLNTFAHLFDVKGMDLKDPIPIRNSFLSKSLGAELIGTGMIGAEEKQPLLWKYKKGKGRVFYLCGAPSGLVHEKTPHWKHTCENIVVPFVLPEVNTPIKTNIKYPAEVWLNKQEKKKRLVLHVLSFHGTLRNKDVAVREDLVDETILEQVYPKEKQRKIEGERRDGYIHFRISDIADANHFTIKCK